MTGPLAEPLTVGVLGCGTVSEPYLRNAEGFTAIEIKACADADLARAFAKAETHGIEAMSVEALLDDGDIELILNLTPAQAHAETSEGVLAAGKHLYSEKPLAVSLAQAKRLFAIADEQGVRIGSAPDSFLGGGQQAARRLLDEGKIGRVIGGHASFISRGVEHWHPDPDNFYRPGGGPLLDAGPHYVTALVNLLGPVARVSAMSATSFETRTIATGCRRGEQVAVQVPTHVTGTLSFVSGALLSLTLSWDVSKHDQRPIELYGSEGSMIVPDPTFFGGTPLFGADKDPWRARPPFGLAFRAPNVTHNGGAVAADYRILGVVDMAYGLRDQRPHRAHGQLAYHVLEVLSGLDTSDRTGRHVDIESRPERPPVLPLGRGEAVFYEEMANGAGAP
ncbi:MAG: Gfo/Idh/MocA family protein [Geminicoccaceae bacterium]